jgi:MSHA pilin protein MshA
MKKKGFTLIELVVAIVILGMLAVTAAPKFIDLTSDARVSALEGMKGVLSSGTDMIYMKAIIDKQTKGIGSIVAGTITISLHSGYPTGYWQGSMRYIAGLGTVNYSTRLSDLEWCGRANQQSLPSGVKPTLPVVIGKVFPKGYSYNDQCGVYYINNLDGSKPDINIETSDC